MSRAKIVTFGCRLNTLESEVMQTHADAAGLHDAVILNTCAVTAEAERQARQTIRRLKRENPEARIIVTGCAAQLDPEKYAAMAEVDRVIGNAEKLNPKSYIGTADEPVTVTDIMTVTETAGHLLDGFESRTRAFVQIQQGCDHRCTFCIIPFARGPNRSVPLARLIEHVRTLVANGHKEIVLTGVDICSYGRDLPGAPSLGAMTRALLDAVPELPRLRFSSLDPAAMTEDFFALLSREPRVMPHLHLSLQAADDMVLKRMKRRHSRDDSLEACTRARAARPDVVFGADLIAGFPTETDAMFENTLAAVNEMGLTYLHVFPYSPRPGTPAANMPQVPKALRAERAGRLREAGDVLREKFFESRVGKTVDVLIEQDGQGHCPQFTPVRGLTDAEPGSIVAARIERAEQSHLIGRLIGCVAS
ncbi:MAG: tRNA (N(6)-L-threonylcarbamoyladenosine(37)-C(2))-methylthiotransferase MtaB [Rhodospirillales bacterium]